MLILIKKCHKCSYTTELFHYFLVSVLFFRVSRDCFLVFSQLIRGGRVIERLYIPLKICCKNVIKMLQTYYFSLSLSIYINTVLYSYLACLGVLRLFQQVSHFWDVSNLCDSPCTTVTRALEPSIIQILQIIPKQIKL